MFSTSLHVLLEDTDSVWKWRGGRMWWGGVGLQTSDADWTTPLLLSNQISQICCCRYEQLLWSRESRQQGRGHLLEGLAKLFVFSYFNIKLLCFFHKTVMTEGSRHFLFFYVFLSKTYICDKKKKKVKSLRKKPNITALSEDGRMDWYGMKCEHWFCARLRRRSDKLCQDLFFFRNDRVFPPAVPHSCLLMTQSPWRGI